MGKWTTYLMKVYLGKLCVSSILIQCKSAIHVIYHIQKPARDHLLRLIVFLMMVTMLLTNSLQGYLNKSTERPSGSGNNILNQYLLQSR